MSRLLGHAVEVVAENLQLVAVDLRHGRRRNVLTVGAVEVAVERRLIEIAVLGVVQHRLALVDGAGTADVVVQFELDVAFAVLRHQLHALLVHVVVAVIALHALLEQPAQQLLAILTHRRSRVGMNLERVWNFHSHYRATATRGGALCAGVGNLLDKEKNVFVDVEIVRKTFS